jgi:hypothetical protein
MGEFSRDSGRLSSEKSTMGEFFRQAGVGVTVDEHRSGAPAAAAR